MIKAEETALIERIGLDRTVVYGFRVKSIDWDKLRSCSPEKVEIYRDGVKPYVLEDGTSFTRLKIIDNNKFSTLQVYTRASYWCDCSRMDICVSNGTLGNFQNDTMADYHRKIHEIFLYLYEVYGVEVDYMNLRFSQMEINTTFPINAPFHEYHRVLKLLFYNLPVSYNSISQYSKVNQSEQRMESETFFRGNNRMQIKAYDKGNQLRQVKGKDLDSNYMRMELVLKESNKVKEVFKTNKVFDITDTMLNEYYMSQIQKLIINRYEKWQIQNRRDLSLIMNSYRLNSAPMWVDKLLRYCSSREQSSQVPFLLDIKDLLLLIKKEDKHGNYNRIKKLVCRQCRESKVYFKNDSEKCEEIFNKIRACYQHFRDTNELNNSSGSDVTHEVNKVK